MNRKILVFALLLSLLITIFPTSVSTFWVTSAASSNTDWTLVTDARAMKAYPDFKEYVYQKNATMPPNGQYDKIGLHRLVKTGITTKGAVFLLAGIYGSGEQLISNPPQSNYSIDESSNTAVYWANRGFDVYSIDYRTHFLPVTFNTTQASAIASNWGWDVYISDMKEAVDKAKTVSGFSKIFLAGMSFGGGVTMYYASKYWQQDLKGIILLDGSENTIKYSPNTNTSNATSSLNSLNATGRLALEYPNTPGTTLPSRMLFLYQYALQNPGAPAQYPPGAPLTPAVNPLTNRTWTNITEWVGYTWSATNFSNVNAGYGNTTVNIQRSAGADRYFPMRLMVETTAFHDWNNCPFISYDFDDHYKEINVPMLGFRSTLYGIPTYGNFINGLGTTDFTQITLPNYGHLDVFTGTYSAKDVSESTYQWMVNHLLQTNPYTDPTAVAWNVDASFSFMDMLRANHTYVPEDKVANPVQKLYISYDEKLLTCYIKVGGVTYSLDKDFTYKGHVDYVYYNPSFANPTLGYYYPSGFSSAEATVNYMYNFSGVPGGLEGTLSMLATSKDGVSSIVSVAGTGDFMNVQVKATISPQWYDAARMVVNIYHDGMVSGWPNAVPAFMTTNTVVTYAQLTDYCVNVWGLPSNPYPAYPANVSVMYHIFNIVIGDKFYLMVGCGVLKSAVSDPAAKTVAMTYNATWYFGDSYNAVAKMDQGFNGPVVATLLNYKPANATATPPTPATYDKIQFVYILQGFGALSGQRLMLRAEGLGILVAKGYAVLP